MGEYGYAYKSVSTYSTTSVRNETRKPAVIQQQPFVPSLPKTTTTDHGYSDGHVTRKTIIPVTSSIPYHDSSTATEKYPSKDDDNDEWHRKTSPVGGSTKPQRFSPMANSSDWRQTPQPTSSAYNSSPESRKPIGSATFNNHDGYNDGHASNGYGSDYGSKKGPHKPIARTIMNDNYDGHNGTNGYGGDYGKGGHKPIASTIRNDNGTNNGYGGDYNSNKEGHKPIGGTIRNDNHNHGTGYYNNGYGGDKEGRKPIGSSTKIDNYQYDGPNGYRGYDDDHYNKKEGYKPVSNPNYNNGYGSINGKNREQHRPFGFGNSTPKDKYDSDDYVNNYNNREGHMQKPIGPKISSAWTAAPRKGTQLSEPTNDIEKALELLRMEAAKREHMHSNTADSDYEYQYDRPKPTHLGNWAAPPGPGSSGSRFAGGSSPQHGSPRVANKFGNSHSQPRMSPTRDTIFDGRDGGDDYYRDEYGHVPVIDSREAEKKFKGTRVW